MNSKKLDYTVLIIASAIFLLLQLPYFVQVQYPFRLLGTWFHEMGHGLTAILVGGDFKYLEIYQNGGGVAYSTVTNKIFSIPTASALTAAGGLLGPAIAGAVLIASAKSRRNAAILLRVLTGVIILSLIIWIRSYSGIVVLSLFSVLFIVIMFLKNKKIENITVLFLGLQCALSTYLQFNYTFTKQFERGGQLMNSDTQNIAINTFGSYWMWGIIIVSISFLLLWKSVKYYLSK
ncbi:Peptidase M50B-like protein [Tenacibaculum sp. 190524A05c]|uniref:M50 family metallopeptidase n=1 Tax=Tenacibaculum platacis TaxID=3137852 RepID=UPI0031FA6294